jgi:hypothetical protein
LKVTLLAAISLIAFSALSSLSSAAGFDTGSLQFKILSYDRKATIGHTRFTVLLKDSIEEVKGETSYVDGERDAEDELLDVAAPAYTPRLETYKHSFFNADGTLSMVDTLDAKSGVASCASYTSGKMKLRKSQLEVPAWESRNQISRFRVRAGT